jgi:hypothetical protein
MASVGQSLSAAGIRPGQILLVGTGIWDDPRIYADANLQGAIFAAPDSVGFRAFADRYRARYSADPVRLATVGYDAVSLVTALAKTQGSQAFNPTTLASPSGFVGVDGAFRFRGDGSNERGLAVLRVTTQGGQTVSPASRTFAS